MVHFQCDYLEGADPRVLEALLDANARQRSGYGEDDACQEARSLIRELAACPEAEVHFLVGGTQANLTVISSALRPWEGVLCADTGHINVHETGAIEATGHKVLALPGQEGKLSASQVQEACQAHHQDATHEHMVKPAMVYISHPTELGTLYTREELEALSTTCKSLGLLLFLDGARLGYGLAADSRVDLPFLAQCCDAFTIGGTKAGLLFGEAVVLANPGHWPCFRYAMKQRGGMLAKGWLLGVQFMALLKDGYYVQSCARANAAAQAVKRAFVDKGFPLLADTVTNQVFPILPKALILRLGENYGFAHWEQVDDGHAAVRFCVSVTTPQGAVQGLLEEISRIGKGESLKNCEIVRILP